MEVLPTRFRDFQSPGLRLPGFEHRPPLRRQRQNVATLPSKRRQNEELYKADPELWRAFRRLSSEKPQNDNGGVYNGYTTKTIAQERRLNTPTKKINIRELAHPNIVYLPGLEGMQCMCYEKLMTIIQSRISIPPPPVFRCSMKDVPKQRSFPCWSKKALRHFRENEELQFPLSTLIGRWQKKRSGSEYDLNSLQTFFKRFGSILDIRLISTQSCIIIFNTLEAACNTMQARTIGDPKNPIHCTWWHRSMMNKAFYVSSNYGLKVKTDPYIK